MKKSVRALIVGLTVVAVACGGSSKQAGDEQFSPPEGGQSPAVAQENWPSFRGLMASGLANAHDLPGQWDAVTGSNIAWRTAIPGLGLSSPTIWGNRLFVTTAVGSEEFPQLRVGLYGESPDNPEPEDHQYRIYCLQKDTGEVLWQKTAITTPPQVQRHIKSSHANCTPATDGQHVVAFFGSEGLYVYDVEGELLWQKDLGHLDAGAFDAPEIQWGFGSSPVIDGDKLVVLCDVNNQSFIAAFDIANGEELWRTDREEVPTWGTPTVVEYAGRKQVIVNGYQHLGSYDLETGRPIWWMTGGGDIPVPTPVIAHGLVFFSNSHGPSRPILAIRLDAEGEISLKEGETSNNGVAWSIPRRGAYIPTPIVVGDELYVLADNGILTCYDARTGEQHYRERLAGERGAFSSSPVAAHGFLYLTEEHGVVHIVKAGAEYQFVTSCELGDPTLTTPAIVGDSIFVRTSREVLGIREGGFTARPARADGKAVAEEPTPERIEIPSKPVNDPVDILRIANQECEAVQNLRYQVEVSGTGAAAPMLGKISASVLASGVVDGAPERFVVDAMVELPNTEGSRHVIGGSDGDRFYLVDFETKTVHTDLEAGVMGSYRRSLFQAIVSEFHVANPFGAEIEGSGHELRGLTDVDGEDCYEVFLIYRETPRAEVVWSFSKRDFLPRARHDLFDMQDGGEGGIVRRIKRLEVIDEIGQDQFVMQIPEGFEVTEQPAR